MLFIHKKIFNSEILFLVFFQKRKPIAILCDVQGPKIRLGKMKDSVSLHIGHKIKVTPEQIVGDKNRARYLI